MALSFNGNVLSWAFIVSSIRGGGETLACCTDSRSHSFCGKGWKVDESREAPRPMPWLRAYLGFYSAS